MGQSYSNPGGSGQRRYLVIIQSTSSWGSGGTQTPIYLVDGSLGNNIWFNTQVGGQYITFDFGQARIIDEAKWYQDNATTQGTWKWQGSADNSTFTDVGSSFTLGGATTQTITAINGNTTAYRYWKMVQTSGSTSSSPYTKGIEFQIDSLDTTVTQYGNTYGIGDRQANITISQSQTAGHGDIIFGFSTAQDPSLAPLVDNLNSAANPGQLQYKSTALAVTGKWIKFQFPDYRIIDEFRWWYTVDVDQATWKLQGSNDNSTWSDLGTTQQINGSFIINNRTYENSAPISCFVFTGCHGNTSSYIYYRMLGTSGSVSNNAGLGIYEIGFRIKAGAAPPSGAIANPFSGVDPFTGFLG
jgi:hypothetical protein